VGVVGNVLGAKVYRQNGKYKLYKNGYHTSVSQDTLIQLVNGVFNEYVPNLEWFSDDLPDEVFYAYLYGRALTSKRKSNSIIVSLHKPLPQFIINRLDRLSGVKFGGDHIKVNCFNLLAIQDDIPNRYRRPFLGGVVSSLLAKKALEHNWTFNVITTGIMYHVTINTALRISNFIKDTLKVPAILKEVCDGKMCMYTISNEMYMLSFTFHTKYLNSKYVKILLKMSPTKQRWVLNYIKR